MNAQFSGHKGYTLVVFHEEEQNKMKLNVSKYHGLGNDFVMLRYADAEGLALPELAREACDRHTGIGADGLILAKEDPLEMVYFNQDGSRAPMCGNGIRCFAAFCYDEGICTEEKYPVETLAGIQQIERVSTEPFRVRIGMGKPDDDREKLKLSEAAPSSVWGYPLPLSSGRTVTLYSFFMGTIHTVLFVPDAFAPENEAIGCEICHHPYFREQTNVNFAEIVDDGHVKMQTYERGCGMTLACGTGACASAVCACRTGRTGRAVDVQLRLGTLHIELDEAGSVWMTGPAERIMKGVYEVRNV